MQYYYDTATNQQYSFEDDVVVTGQPGALVFTAAHGAVLGPYPSTMVAGMVPPPPLAAQLATAQAVQNNILTQACASAIVSGFSSSALGSEYQYPSDVNTQSNIDRASASGGYLWCAPASNAWGLVSHTQSQAAQVRTDLWSYIQTQQSKLATLRQQIAAATTVSAVQAVTW